MIQTLIHTSENDNLYIYDPQSKLSILVPPEFQKAYEKSPNADPYYLKKIEYLTKHGFFSMAKPINFVTIDESAIKNNINQIPQIVFETTNFCNLACTYCSLGEVYEGFDERNQGKINIDHAITLLKYIFGIKHKSKKNKLIISFYGGEPLFNGDFVKKIVDVAKQLNSNNEMEIEYSITTNATFLHKYMSFLAENNFYLLISLDGNEINHSYRLFKKDKQNSFHKVIENIDKLQKEYPQYFADYVKFNAVLHNRNSVKEIYEFIYSRYSKIPRIAELASNDVNPDKLSLYNKIYHNKRESESEYVKEESNLLPHEELLLYGELTDFLKYYSVNSCISEVLDLLPGDKKYVPTSTCLPFWKKVMLTTNSKLALCEKVDYHKITVGEVGEDVKFNISEMVKQYNFYYEHAKKKCQYCYANKYCKVCLYIVKNNNLDKLDSLKFCCEYFQDKKSFSNRLYRIFSFLEKYPKDNYSIIENVIIIRCIYEEIN